MCQCGFTTNTFSFKMDIYKIMTISSRMGGSQNYETYWVGGRNISFITRAKYIQDQRPNDFCSDSIIAKNCMEGLPEEKNLSLDEFKSKITLMIRIA